VAGRAEPGGRWCGLGRAGRSRRREDLRSRHDHHEISVGPGDLGGHTCSFEPGDLVVELAWVVDLGIDVRHDVQRVDWLDDVPEDEPASWSKDKSDPSEEISLVVGLEMVDREGRHDEIKSASRQRILEPPDDQGGATRIMPGLRSMLVRCASGC